MLFGRDFARRLRIATVSMGGQAGATRAAVHRGDEDGRGAAQASFGDVDLEVGLVGGLGLDVGLRPACLRVVVRELEEEVVALLHLAENLVQAQRVHEGLQCLSRLRVVRDGHARLEEGGQELTPTDVAAAVAVGHGGVAGEEDGGGSGHRGDLDGTERCVRAVDLKGQLRIPVAGVAAVELVERDLFAARGVQREFRQVRGADVGGDGAFGDLAGGDVDALEHQAAGFGFDGSRGCGRGVAEGDLDVEVAFGNFGGEEEGLVTGGGGAAVAVGDGSAGFVAVAGVVGVHRRWGDAGEAGLGGAGAEVECEVDGRRLCDRWRIGGRRGLSDGQGSAEQGGEAENAESTVDFPEWILFVRNQIKDRRICVEMLCEPVYLFGVGCGAAVDR